MTLNPEAPEDTWQAIRQILGNQTRAEVQSSLDMQKRGCFGSCKGGKSARHQPCDEPGQHVTRPGSGKPWRCALCLGCMYRRIAIGRCNNCVLPFEQDRASRTLGRCLRSLWLGAGSRCEIGKKAREFPGMGCQDAVWMESDKKLSLLCDQRKGICIQNCRAPGIQCNIDKPDFTRRESKTRAKTDTIDPRIDKQLRQLTRVGNRRKHHSIKARCVFDQGGRRTADRHKPRPDPERRARRQPRCAAASGTTRQDQRMSMIILVPARRFAQRCKGPRIKPHLYQCPKPKARYPQV